MRKDFLDIAKGLGILLVVLGHSLELYLGDGSPGRPIFTAWKLIYSFHMPLFFLLSGMATPRLGGVRLEKSLHTALTLIITATVLQLVFAPLRLALGDGPGASLPQAIRAVFWPALKFEGYAFIVIWFLPCLALVRLAVWLIANATRAGAAACILVLVLLCVAEHHAGIGYFQLRSIIVGVAFFAIGQRVAELAPDRLPRPACWIAFAAALLLTGLTFDVNHGCTFDPVQTCPGPRYGAFAVLMVSGSFGFLPLFALTALSGCAAILAASILLAASPLRRPLALIGRRTLDLLVVNGLVLVFVQPWLAAPIGGITPPIVVVPLVLAQLAAAYALHPALAPLFALARSAATWLASPRSHAHALIEWAPSSEERR